MSTNDTLRGLLPCPFCCSTTGVCDSSFPHPRTVATVKQSLTVRKAYVVYADNGNVICFSTDRQHHSVLSLEEKGYPVVVLAEPVSGGVRFPERASRSNVDVTLGALGMYGRVDIGQAVKIYNQALDDFAALNGGAVAGQSPAAVLAAKGVSSRSLGAEFASVLADNLQDLLITDDEPLESERGGE